MKKLIKFLIVLILIIISILLYSRFIGTKGLKVKEYKVVSDKIINEYHGLKIIHLSDIHYGSTIFVKDLNKMVDEINTLNPDIVVLTGDLIDEKRNPDKDAIIKCLSLIKPKIGKYAVSGNHDLPNETFKDIIKKSGFINLDNKYELIYNHSNKPIIISGISSNINDTSAIDVKTKEIDTYLSTLAAEDKPIYSILLIHEPDYIDNLKMDNYDLILAGHSHGGQVKLPIIGKLFTPQGSKKYYNEEYKINNSNLYISSGMGTSILRLRLFNKPSVNFYRITKN
ncbi:MAG: metallophosphoesterase [Bacilli bacterium]